MQNAYLFLDDMELYLFMILFGTIALIGIISSYGWFRSCVKLDECRRKLNQLNIEYREMARKALPELLTREELIQSYEEQYLQEKERKKNVQM